MLTMYSGQGVADDDEEEQIHENTTSIVHLAIFPWFVLHNTTTTTAANGDHGPTNYGNAGPCPFVGSIVFCCLFSILRLDNSFCSLLSRFGGHHTTPPVPPSSLSSFGCNYIDPPSQSQSQSHPDPSTRNHVCRRLLPYNFLGN